MGLIRTVAPRIWGYSMKPMLSPFRQNPINCMFFFVLLLLLLDSSEQVGNNYPLRASPMWSANSLWWAQHVTKLRGVVYMCQLGISLVPLYLRFSNWSVLMVLYYFSNCIAKFLWIYMYILTINCTIVII
jgi:hypothetical protein